MVEDRNSSLFKLEHTKPGFVSELLAALTVRYPTVPIHSAETRPLAEEWTYRLRVSTVALRALALGERLPRDRSGEAEVR